MSGEVHNRLGLTLLSVLSEIPYFTIIYWVQYPMLEKVSFMNSYGVKLSQKISKKKIRISENWKNRPVKSISVKYLDWRNPLLVDLIILTRTASNPSLYFILTRKDFLKTKSRIMIRSRWLRVLPSYHREWHRKWRTRVLKCFFGFEFVCTTLYFL